MTHMESSQSVKMLVEEVEEDIEMTDTVSNQANLATSPTLDPMVKVEEADDLEVKMQLASESEEGLKAH